ncbi:hypothetical protein VspSTUT16_13820 [Vibrio sp. STUT-A16]|nr:hypothetical protein VspSTUT16_13820 [Vibrio sp. STUT-A16]
MKYYRKLTLNKQFKSDSARLAFLVWVKFSVYGGQVKCRGRALHTLIGRYVNGVHIENISRRKW